jgi:hypothetical protein
MGKLSYRLDAGRGGGCPILAFGIRPNVVSDFETWKLSNPIIKETDFNLTDEVEDDEDDD